MADLKAGEFVEFFPNGNTNGTQLPNGANSAPAIVVEVTPDGLHLNVFTADFDGGNPVKQAWKVQHKKNIKGDVQYWDYAQ